MNHLTRKFLVILLTGLVIRLILSPYLSYYLDIDTYIYWANYLSSHPLNEFYSNVWSDYLPGYHYILWLMALFQQHFLPNNTPILYQLYKLPSIISDIINAIFIYKIAVYFITPKKALITTIIYLSNIALLANSTFWGQSDSFMSLFILASIFFVIQNNLTSSALFIGFGQVVKPITLLTIPLNLIYIFSPRSPIRSFTCIIYFLIITLLVWLLTFIPFADKNIFSFISERYLTSFHQYSYSSLNAFNFWGATVGFWVPDNNPWLFGINYQTWGNILLFGNYFIICLSLLYSMFHQSVTKKIFLLVYANALSFYAMFLFLTRIHERHNMAALVCLSVIILAVNKKTTFAIFIAFIIYLLNLGYAYFQLTYQLTIFDRATVQLLSLINILSFGYLMYFYLKQSFQKHQ